ncbi:transcriptional regulator [Aeromonas cavernicola]|uniref:Transcriptional regulator n=2 Tax=Aeromonas cavernicola TaxID=1006623 RepID=A0A2H9U2W5_9GAMM|nr:transcriptional regulator [Aeromonas cavernicola]
MHHDYSRAIPQTWQQIAKLFNALGDEHRQRIMLTFEPGERLTAGQLAQVSTLSRPTVSHHLKILREAGVLEHERQGKEIYFWVNKDFIQGSLQQVITYLKNDI